jgi:hypothetical protein
MLLEFIDQVSGLILRICARLMRLIDAMEFYDVLMSG